MSTFIIELLSFSLLQTEIGRQKKLFEIKQVRPEKRMSTEIFYIKAKKILFKEDEL